MNPAVSVVIPCFNLGAYLDEAVQSVLDQTYEDLEIIIVDDGSDDPATRHLLASYRRPRTRILRIDNKGVAGARNAGLSAAAGSYVSFLDADDVLEPRFLERTVGLLDSEESLAFASCWLTAFGASEFIWQPDDCDIPWLLAEDTVCTASPTRREALEAINGYDEDPRLDGFEDWDLAITLVEKGLRGSIVSEPLFRYRMRLGSKWTVRGRPESYSHAFERLVDKHTASYREHAARVLDVIGGRVMELEQQLPGEAPPWPSADRSDWRRAIVSLEDHRRRLEESVTGRGDTGPGGPGPAAIDWGSLRRLEPVSRVWGLDRGKPIDRHYVEAFLQAHSGAIGGDVLEVKDPGYTKRFHTGARSVTVLDISDANHDATLIADLEAAGAVPAGRFDCIVLTQTIHLTFQIEQVIRNVHEALAPGGVALATVPCVSRLDYEAGVEGDFWRFTAASARRLFEQVFGAGNVEVQAFGNLISCTAFLQGLATEELEAAELDSHDPYFPLVVGVRALKAPSAASVERPPPAVEGSLDEATCSAISGWAWSRNAPERRLRLELRIGDKCIGDVWSDEPRRDLAEAGKGNGRVAFRFVPETRLHGEDVDEITVIPVGGGNPLAGSPRRVECRCAEPRGMSSAALAGAAIDTPPPGARLDFPWLDLTGWALGRHGPVEGIELVSAGVLCRRVPTGVGRPDLVRAFPDLEWARAAGFATRVSLVGSGGHADLELRAVLGDGERIPIGRVAGRATETPAAPVVAVLDPADGAGSDNSALLSQQTPVSRVLVRRGAAVTGHPGFAATPAWNQALDDGAALVWLCDGQEDVTATFVSQAAATLAEHPALSFAVASELAEGPASGRELIGALSGTALGSTLVFRASAARAVGGLDESADGAAAALWDLAVRLAEAGHEWVEVAASRVGAPTLAERCGEAAVRWLYRKHEGLYRRHLAEVVLDREVIIGRLLRDNHLKERALEGELRPRLRARRRERDRLGAKLRSRRPDPAAGGRDAASELGDFWRLEPVSPLWGAERGLCVDRYYIERFLRRNAGDIRGAVLASPDAVYARRYGGSRLERCDVIDADSTSAEAAIIAGLHHVPEIASGSYDCALLPHVLHLVEEPAAVLAEFRRMLKPGGVLLVTVPCAARLEPDNADGDRWRFSAQGLTSLLETAFAGGDLRVHGEGNGDALVASLTGLAAEEVGTDRLERDDPAMPLLATARVVTPRGEAEA